MINLVAEKPNLASVPPLNQTGVLPSVAGKLRVNLLPEDLLMSRQHNFKLMLVNRLSIILLITLIFFTSLTISLKFAQNLEIGKIKENVAYAENQVSALREKEEQIVVLKQRLKSIDSLLGHDDKRKAIFNLIVFLTPADIEIFDAGVDKNGTMTLTMRTSSLPSIEKLITNLGDQEKNSNLIATVNLEGLSLGRDSIYRFSLKITTK